MKKNWASEILLAIVLAIAGWNLLETISLGKAVAALQVEIHRRDASNRKTENENIANTDLEPSRSTMRLRDIAKSVN